MRSGAWQGEQQSTMAPSRALLLAAAVLMASVCLTAAQKAPRPTTQPPGVQPPAPPLEKPIQ